MIEIPSLAKYFISQKRTRGKDRAPIKVMNFRRSPDLYQLFDKLGYTKGVEVGVRWGENALKMCEIIPKLDLTVIDMWTEYKDTDRLYSNKKHQRFYEKAKEILAVHNVTFMRMFSMEAVREFALGSLDFVYIDANHKFDYIMEDLIEWVRKVRVGGIVSGHDFTNYIGEQVVEAVDIYTKVHGIKELFMTDEQDPSFFWRKT